jgi:hypothetical protein
MAKAINRAFSKFTMDDYLNLYHVLSVYIDFTMEQHQCYDSKYADLRNKIAEIIKNN